MRLQLLTFFYASCHQGVGVTNNGIIKINQSEFLNMVFFGIDVEIKVFHLLQYFIKTNFSIGLCNKYLKTSSFIDIYIYIYINTLTHGMNYMNEWKILTFVDPVILIII